MRIYIRKGRCFKEVPNYIGMFYDGEHFTTERTDRSYAVCYDQKGTTCYLAKIEFEPRMFTFDEAGIKTCNQRPLHLPTREQAMIAFSSCPILRSGIHRSAWTQEEYGGYAAWYLGWNEGEVYYSHKLGSLYVRLFFEITIEV